MKKSWIAIFAVCLGGIHLSAQPSAEQLQQQLQKLQEQFQKQQEEHQRQIQELKNQIEQLRSAQEESIVAADPRSMPEKSWRPTDPIRVRRGQAYIDVGLIGTFSVGTSTADDIEGGLQPGGHDPNQRGFTLQGLELGLSGAVDPYFRGNANILFSIDSEGESFLELEEAWMETLSLPANLQLRAGQILTEFGRHNTLHPHSWAFVDAPLVNARLLGPDGLRNPGARLSWLLPFSFYSELFLSVQNSHGATAASFRSGGHHHGEEEEEEIPFAFRHAENDRGVRNLGDLLFTPRYAISFDLTDAHTILFGASAAFGPNASGEESQNTSTQIYGLDFTWKWKPINHSGGYPFIAWQTEGLWRRYKAGEFDWDENGDGLLDEGELDLDGDGIPDVLPRETLHDYGFYSQISYGFRRGLVAGVRFDWVRGRRGDYESLFGSDPARAERWRLSPNLTWFPTEFSKIRLQYNYDDRRLIGRDHSVWLQFEYVLGAHGAHRF